MQTFIVEGGKKKIDGVLLPQERGGGRIGVQDSNRGGRGEGINYFKKKRSQ